MRVRRASISEPRFARAIALSLALCLLTSTALAGPPTVEALYEQGKAALGEQAPAVALGRFKDALKQAKGDEGWTWRLLLAVALAYQDKGEPEHAIEYYRRFLVQTDEHQATMTQKWKRRRAITGEQLVTLEQEIEKTHGFVSVTTQPPGAEITVDGTRAGADRDAVTPFGLIIEPGKHSVRINLAGYAPVEKMVTVRAGDSQPVRLDLVAIAASTAKPAAPVATPKPTIPTATAPAESAPTVAAVDAGLQERTSPPSAEVPIGAWVVIGTASAAAVAGVAMTVLASQEAESLETWEAQNIPTGSATLSDEQGAALYAEFDSRNGTVETYELLGGALYGVALAAAVGGVVWMLLAEPDATEDAENQAARLMPELLIAPSPGGVSGHATWRF
jgi:hypothetical protein